MAADALDAGKAAAATPNDAAKKAAAATAEKAAADAKAEVLKYQVNPPYAPKMKSLSVSYRASTEVVMQAYGGAEATDQILHVHPFGI